MEIFGSLEALPIQKVLMEYIPHANTTFLTFVSHLTAQNIISYAYSNLTLITNIKTPNMASSFLKL